MTTIVIAKAVLQNGAGDILLVRRSSMTKKRPGEWDLPGGTVEDDEDFTAAAIREINEETGIRLGHHDLHLAHTQQGETPLGENTCFLNFVGFVKSDKVKLSQEHDAYKWLPLEEAIAFQKYPRHNEILRHIRDKQLLD